MFTGLLAVVSAYSVAALFIAEFTWYCISSQDMVSYFPPDLTSRVTFFPSTITSQKCAGFCFSLLRFHMALFKISPPYQFSSIFLIVRLNGHHLGYSICIRGNTKLFSRLKNSQRHNFSHNCENFLLTKYTFHTILCLKFPNGCLDYSNHIFHPSREKLKV